MYETLNQNFSEEEIGYAIKSLKNGKAAGVDSLPAELIKCASESITPDLTTMFNYILEKRDFPLVWAEGLKSAIHKSGAIDD